MRACQPACQVTWVTLKGASQLLYKIHDLRVCIEPNRIEVQLLVNLRLLDSGR